MAKLFVGSREVDLMNDVAREVVKDIVGQVVYLYPIDYARTLVHDVYAEAPEKVFDTPIELDAVVKWQPSEQTTTTFGHDTKFTIEVYIQFRDLLYNNVRISPGDFLSYDDVFYEVTSVIETDKIAGQVEYTMGVKLHCVQARQDQFLAQLIGPTSERNADTDAPETTFVQKRGFDENRLGPTGDTRDLIRRGVLDPPVGGPREVSPRGAENPDESVFYDEDV